MADKGGFPHYMLKEIFEQPQGLRDTVLPRLSPDKQSIQLDTVNLDAEMRALNRINILASGTSRHAGMAGQFMIQELANVPVDVDYASEFEYRNPLIGRGELTIVITQSGETADTLAAQREAKAKHSKTIAISNVEGSTIAREADGVLYTFAGQEISIASTKAFTAQMAVLFMLAAYLGKIRDRLDQARIAGLIDQLLHLPSQTEKVLECAPQVSEIAEQYHLAQDFLFLGRAIHYPVAMDGALKLKEVSYIHAEGYPTGETKHGPNALIDYSVPVVIIATCDREDAGSVIRYEKTVSNIRGFKQQSGSVIAIASEGDTQVAELADHTIFLPRASELLSPILEIIPLQLFAYYVAVRRGLDVDRPRNLVKSVNVE